MNIWTLLKISSHSDPRSLNCSSWFRFSLKSIFHLSMVGDGLDAVVHGALLSLAVHAGDDGMAGVCNRDDPFLHLPTLLVIGNQMTMVMINDDNDNANDNDNGHCLIDDDSPLGERSEADYHLQPKLHQCIVSET